MQKTSQHNLPAVASKLPVLVLGCGLGLGLLADQLFGQTGPVGLGFFTWTLLFALVLNGLAVQFSDHDPRLTAAWSLVAVSAASLVLVRTTPIVVLALLLVMIVAMAMVLLHQGRRSLAEITLTEQVRALFLVPWQGLSGALPMLARVNLARGLKSPRCWSVLRGALLAMPLLLVFAALFSAADAHFASLFERLLGLISERTVQHLVLSAVFGWLAAGLLASITGNHFFEARRDWRPLRLGTEDTAVLLGLLTGLFLVFVVVQLGYLFGGRDTIEATSGLTLAQYARRGFFELLAVAGLTLALLILVAGSGCNLRVFRPLAATLLGCVVIIQVSAVQRLLLYIDQYGLTIDRLTALAVLVWLAIGLALFAATLWRGRERLFATGLTLAGVVVVCLLALSNPAALVARTNIARAEAGPVALDLGYLLNLGDDAVPVLVKHFADQSWSADQCVAFAQLYSRWYQYPPSGKEQGWRSWNLGQQRARRAIGQFEERLKELASPCLGNGGYYIHFSDLSQSFNQPALTKITPPTVEQMNRWIRNSP